ncbi:MAG: hypothetical protein ABSD31_01415 [Candidatus Binataceae bacterium]
MSIDEKIEHWLELIVRRRSIATRVFLAVVGFLTVASLIWPPIFKSTGEVLVQANPAQLLVSPGMQSSTQTNQPTVLTNPVSQEDLNSEIELLTSRYLMERTIERLKVKPENTGLIQKALAFVETVIALPQTGYNMLHSVAAPTDDQELAVKLGGKLSVDAIKRSNVIEVSFRSHDASRAQVFLSQLLDQYLELHALLSHDPEAQAVFVKQAAVLDQRLRSSEESLRDAQLKTGISDLDAQRLQLVTQLYTLETEEHKTSADLAAARKQADYIKDQIASTPQRQIKESQTVQNNALQTLKPLVLQLETQRAELLSRYQTTSKKIENIDVQLAAAREIIAREDATKVRQISTDINPTWAALDVALAQARYQSASLEANEQTLLKRVDDFRHQLDKLASDGVVVQRMQRQVDADREAYTSYLRKGEEARAAEALNQKKILNVSVIQPPSFPIMPMFPNMPINVAAGVVLGLLVGLAAADWEESSDQTLYSAAAVWAESELPVVASIKDNGIDPRLNI